MGLPGHTDVLRLNRVNQMHRICHIWTRDGGEAIYVEVQYTRMRLLKPIEDEQCALGQHGSTISWAMTCHIGQFLKCSTITSHWTSHGLKYHSFINHLVYFHLILAFTIISNTYSHLLTLLCLRGSVGIYYSVFGSTCLPNYSYIAVYFPLVTYWVCYREGRGPPLD